MDFESYQNSLNNHTPPEGLSTLLEALWWDAKGNWEKAHQLAQGVNNTDGAWVHAYLHRKEGNDGNAGYWYSRSGKSHPQKSLDDEWLEIVEFFLD